VKYIAVFKVGAMILFKPIQKQSLIFQKLFSLHFCLLSNDGFNSLQGFCRIFSHWHCFPLNSFNGIFFTKNHRDDFIMAYGGRIDGNGRVKGFDKSVWGGVKISLLFSSKSVCEKSDESEKTEFFRMIKQLRCAFLLLSSCFCVIAKKNSVSRHPVFTHFSHTL